MLISQGVFDPNCTHKAECGKGRPVNIPVKLLYVRQRKSDVRRFGLGGQSINTVNSHNTGESCHEEILYKVRNSAFRGVPLMP